MKRGPVELGSDEEEGESEGKVINQIFGRLQHPKMGLIRHICAMLATKSGLHFSPVPKNSFSDNW